jgi:hypothetical protein
MRPSVAHPLQVSHVRLSPPSLGDKARGVVAFLRFCIGGIELDGVTLRRQRDGKLMLSFPARRDSRGRQHEYVRLGDDERRSVEGQVLRILEARISP